MTAHAGTAAWPPPAPEEGGRSAPAVAFFLGGATIVAAVLLGRSYSFYLPFLGFSLCMVLLWRKAPRPLVFLLSICAATPIAVSKQQFTCNLILALFFVLLNLPALFRLPKWLLVSALLTLTGVVTSMGNWISDDLIRSLMRQGALAYNLYLGPFLILPAAYLGMRHSRDHALNLKGLLFCLIIPSTVLLLSAKLIGAVTNEWEASLHAESLADGFLRYRLGNVMVNFLRTEVGFILAALICAATAVATSSVGATLRLLAGGCVGTNAFLLLSTGSFGSGFSCLCGICVILMAQLRRDPLRALASVTAVFAILLLTYQFAPSGVKGYLAKRYQHRVVRADTDRVALWARGVDHLLRHPEGSGFTFTAGEGVKTYIHNDYLVYGVSYGVIGGLGYLCLVAGVLLSFLNVPGNALRDPAALAVYLAGLGVTVALALNSITDHSNENRWYFNVIWSLIWYCYFCSRPAEPGAAVAGVAPDAAGSGPGRPGPSGAGGWTRK